MTKPLECFLIVYAYSFISPITKNTNGETHCEVRASCIHGDVCAATTNNIIWLAGNVERWLEMQVFSGTYSWIN